MLDARSPTTRGRTRPHRLRLCPPKLEPWLLLPVSLCFLAFVCWSWGSQLLCSSAAGAKVLRVSPRITSDGRVISEGMGTEDVPARAQTSDGMGKEEGPARAKVPAAGQASAARYVALHRACVHLAIVCVGVPANALRERDTSWLQARAAPRSHGHQRRFACGSADCSCRGARRERSYRRD